MVLRLIHYLEDAIKQDINISDVAKEANVSIAKAIAPLEEAGRKVPEELSVISFDNLFMSSYTVPSLFTISQNIGMRGTAAVRLLFNQLDDGNEFSRKVVLPVELTIRETIGKPFQMK